VRWAWVRPGGNPDIPFLIRKARAWGLERLLFDANDPQINPDLVSFEGITYLQRLRQLGATGGPIVGPGITVASDWDNGQFAAAKPFAQKTDAYLSWHGFGPTTRPDSCVVELNREVPHDPDDQLAMLWNWRQLRKTRWSIWSLEAHQAGWFDTALIDFLRGDGNLWVVFERYLGPNEKYWPVEQSWALAGADVLDRGQVKSAFYPVDRVPVGWDGVIFDFALLPDTPPVQL
jgi:hypothetical protein